MVVLVHHFGLWAWTSWHRGISPLLLLDRWDSHHYSTLVLDGYTWPLWAFLPLYPGLVWLLRCGSTLPPQFVGTALSTACLLAFIGWNTHWGRHGYLREGLTARSSWGWFVFLCSPASFALHSHHTEGLFLLLSFGALACASRGVRLPSGLLVALCIFTRNQGCFVAIAAALLFALREQTWRERMVRFVSLGCVAVPAFGGLLVFEWSQSGDPLMFLKAQREWNHVDSVWGAIRGVWFGNPWHQGFSWWLLLRNIFGAAWLVFACLLWRRDRALGLYALLSFLVMLPQGDLGNAFRFGAVLFPVLFLAGDWLATRAGWLRWTVALLLVWLNHKVTHAYAIGKWPY
ncbi:hypothetical protein [Corallococcus sp. Z5C101001]|uniref:hypothetical protein n=1 Tax=Corallococcus sp. Z5C101001 TaxID=2596829 RepID=UPI00117C9D6A|nr:hypothetical protein [Corallococcus sp. Z5C101001]TSC25795.1 hypothetical protein FOF48_22550 [Corallococcus sp. Z5C101001]